MSRRPNVAMALAAARDALSAGAASTARPDHVGDLVWWDPSQGWIEECSIVDSAWRHAGLDPAADLPPHTDYGTAFSRSVASVSSSVSAQGYVLKKVGPIDGDRREAIVREMRNGKYTSDDQGTVRLPADGLSAPYIESASTPAATAIGDTLVTMTKTLRHKYSSDDIRAAVTRMIDRWAGLPCRQCPPHVVYWVPGPAADTIRRMADLVETIGWGQIQIVAAHRSDARSLRAATSAASQGLEAALSDFARDAEKYALADHARTRESTIAARLLDAKALRERGELYRAILGSAVSSIEDRISQVETSLRETLFSVQSASL